MGSLPRRILIACLTVVYILALLAALHPKVSPNYRAHYIDHTSLDWNPPHYPGTPDEGISFGRKGLPEWISWSYGFSEQGPGGQWTDDDLGNVAGLVFDHPLSGTFCVEFRAAPAPHMRSSFDLRLGRQSETIPLKSGGVADYQAQFNEVHEAGELEFVLPAKLPRIRDIDPPNRDPRRLGLLLITLKIHTTACSDIR